MISNKMKWRVLCLLFLLPLMAAMPAKAQETVVTGIVRDSITHEGEAFATIRVFARGNMTKPVAMSVTDADGHITQKVKGRGDFVLTVASMGRQTITRKLKLNGEAALDLGKLLITDDAKSLKAVEVTALRPVVKMTTDKMTYSVQDDVDSKTMNLLDMLRKVPMVNVDAQDNITVNGSGSFTVYVDGKPNKMYQSNLSQIAKAVPASMVQSIDVITSPGAKYDAEGTTGVLDIKLVHVNGAATEQMNSYSGNVEVRLSNHGHSANAYVGGQQGKFTYSASAFVNKGRGDLSMTSERVQKSEAGDATIANSMSYKLKSPFMMGDLSLGYELDSLSSVNVNMGMMRGNQNHSAWPLFSFRGGAFGTGYDYTAENHVKSEFTGFNASADYQRFFNADHTSSFTLSYLFDYNPGVNQNRMLYQQDPSSTAPLPADLYSDSHTWGTSHTVQGDFTLPLSKKQTLETGAKWISRRNKSDSKYYDVTNGQDVPNAAYSVNYRNMQSIVAAYAQYRLTTEKFNARAGLRYEYTFEDVKYADHSERNFKKDYGDLVPSGSLGYNFSPTTNLGITYTMRISRPGINQLNPYVDRTNPNVLSYGNPSLSVARSHNVALTFNTFTPKFMMNLTLSENYCGNETQNYSFLEDDVLNTTYTNNGKSSSTSLNAYMRWGVTKTTTLMMNGAVSYGDWRARELNLSNYGWGARGYFSVEQQLPWKVKGSLGLFATTKQYSLMGWQSGMNFMNVSLTRTFLKDRLEVSTGYAGPVEGKIKMDNFSHSADFSSMTKVRIPLRIFMLSVKWNFGNTKKQFSAKQSKINNDFNDSQRQSSPATSMGQMGGM